MVSSWKIILISVFSWLSRRDGSFAGPPKYLKTRPPANVARALEAAASPLMGTLVGRVQCQWRRRGFRGFIGIAGPAIAIALGASLLAAAGPSGEGP